MRTPGPRALLGVARAVAFPAAVVLVALMAVRAAGRLDFARVDPLPLAAAALPLAAWWVLLARAWGLVHSGHAHRDDLRTWCRTQALRYLPGGVWAPVSRAVAVEGRVADRVSTVAAENVVALCAALAVGGLALGVSRSPAWLALVVVAALPIAAAPIFGRLSRVDGRRLRRATVNDLAGFVAYAISAVLVQTAVSGDHAPLAVAGAAAVAWAAGLVVLITPGGVGVREVAYIWLMHGTGVPHSALVLAAVAARLLSVVVELGVLLVLGREAGRNQADDPFPRSPGTVRMDGAPSGATPPRGGTACES